MKPLRNSFATGVIALALLTVGSASHLLAASGRVVPQGTEYCAANPNPVTNGQQYFITGGGFKPGQVLSLFVGSGTILMTAADTNGNFSAWSWASFRTSGPKDVTIYQQGDRKKTVLTTCSFTAN